jgi:hypothetical protein
MLLLLLLIWLLLLLLLLLLVLMLVLQRWRVSLPKDTEDVGLCSAAVSCIQASNVWLRSVGAEETKAPLHHPRHKVMTQVQQLAGGAPGFVYVLPGADTVIRSQESRFLMCDCVSRRIRVESLVVAVLLLCDLKRIELKFASKEQDEGAYAEQ